MYKHQETKDALNDWEKIKSMSKSVKEKFKYFLVDILENPRNMDTVGNPERLKYTEKEMWSRELTKKDRIVYGIELRGLRYHLLCPPYDAEYLLGN